jgi:hypothetical protein
MVHFHDDGDGISVVTNKLNNCKLLKEDNVPLKMVNEKCVLHLQVLDFKPTIHVNNQWILVSTGRVQGWLPLYRSLQSA